MSTIQIYLIFYLQQTLSLTESYGKLVVYINISPMPFLRTFTPTPLFFLIIITKIAVPAMRSSSGTARSQNAPKTFKKNPFFIPVTPPGA